MNVLGGIFVGMALGEAIRRSVRYWRFRKFRRFLQTRQPLRGMR